MITVGYAHSLAATWFKSFPFTLKTVALADGRLLALLNYSDGVHSVEAFPNGTTGDQLTFGLTSDPAALAPAAGIALAGGGAVVYDTRTVGISNLLDFQIIDNSMASLVGPQTNITSVANSTVVGFELAPLGDGGFVAEWATSAAPTDSRAAIYNANGSVRVAAFDIAGSGDLLGLAGGGFMLLHDNGAGATLADRYDANGAAVGGSTTFAANYTDIVELGDGGFALLLANEKIQIFNADGSARTGQISAPTVPMTTTSYMDLLGLVDGNVAIEMRWQPQIGAEQRYLALVSPTGDLLSYGSPVSPEFHAGTEAWSRVFGDNLVLQEYSSTGEVMQFYRLTRVSESDAVGDTIMGVASSEYMYGNAGNDTLQGLGGDDFLYGGADTDVLQGGDGADTLDGGSGADAMSGGNGDDRVIYDSADDFANVQGGAGYDFLLVNDATSVPTHLTLAANGFEQANVEFIDHGSESWSKITIYANGSWATLARTILYDDNTRLSNFYDYNSTQTWSSYDQSYNASNQLVHTRTFYDAGGYETQFYDLGGQSWSSYLDYSNASNQLLSRRTFLDNGRYETIYFDYNNTQSYSQYIDFSNTSGQVDARRAILDTGRYETTYLDVANTQSWSEYTDYSTATGVIDARRVVYDNHYYTYTYYDVQGTQPWAYYTDSFDPLGNFLGRSGQNDDGSFF